MTQAGPLAARILDLARGLGVALGRPGAQRLAAYVDALLEQGQRRNLSAARTVDDVLRILLAPSLPLGTAWGDEQRPPRRVMDVGSGNGFPGVVAAALWPQAQVLLVERRERKAEALAAAAAGWPALEVLGMDARDIPARMPQLRARADLITFRAVGPLAECNRIAGRLLAPLGRVVHWKPMDLLESERGAGASAASEFCLRTLPDIVPPPPGTGRLVIYEAESAGG